MSAGYRDRVARLRQQAGTLGHALLIWAAHDRFKGASAQQVATSSTALSIIDDMLSVLYDIRTQLVTERRADQELRARRADEARKAGERP